MNNDLELNKAKQYVRDLTSGTLLFAESRLVAETLLLGLPECDWNRLFTEDNYSGPRNPDSTIRWCLS